MGDQKPSWKPYDEGGGYTGQQWLADGITVIVMCTAEWYVSWESGNAHGTAISVAAAERFALNARRFVRPILQDHQAMRKERRWPTSLMTLMREILGKHPEATRYCWPRPIWPMIIEKSKVRKSHFVVSDEHLLDLAYSEIERHNCGCDEDVAEPHRGADAVLILSASRLCSA